MKQYIIRLDDISWDMNYENFEKIRELLKRYGIKPLIGVIPNNGDKSLRGYVGDKKIEKSAFWDEIRDLQDKEDWSVALHGYDHVYVTEEGGIFNINPRAEFAGLSYEIQNEKIKKGKQILEAEKVRIDAFMAPGHSLDWITVKALQDNGVFFVTDGTAYFPYKEKDMWFIPQTSPWFRKGFIGVDTACFHINSWKDEHFDRLERYLRKNANKFIGFSEVIRHIDRYDRKMYMLCNKMATVLIPLENNMRKVASRILNAVRKG